MQVRRQPRQRKTSFRKAGMLLAALVLISTTARHWMPLLYALGEQAAVLSVAVNDPQAGLALLEDRFAGDLYDPEEDDTSEPEDAIPFEPSEEESSSQTEETAPGYRAPTAGIISIFQLIRERQRWWMSWPLCRMRSW